MLALLQLYRRRYGNRKSVYGASAPASSCSWPSSSSPTSWARASPAPGPDAGPALHPLNRHAPDLDKLPDVVRVNVYITGKLPSQFQSVIRDIKDLLRDYQTYGGGNVVVTYKDPTGKTDVATEAQQNGVAPSSSTSSARRNTSGRTATSAYISRTPAVTWPFVIQDTSDLEYQLTSDIKKLTDKEKKKVVFLSGHGEAVTSTSSKVLAGELGKEFDVSDLDLTQANATIPADTAAVVLGGPTQKLTTSRWGRSRSTL